MGIIREMKNVIKRLKGKFEKKKKGKKKSKRLRWKILEKQPEHWYRSSNVCITELKREWAEEQRKELKQETENKTKENLWSYS